VGHVFTLPYHYDAASTLRLKSEIVPPANPGTQLAPCPFVRPWGKRPCPSKVFDPFLPGPAQNPVHHNPVPRLPRPGGDLLLIHPVPIRLSRPLLGYVSKLSKSSYCQAIWCTIWRSLSRCCPSTKSLGPPVRGMYERTFSPVRQIGVSVSFEELWYRFGLYDVCGNIAVFTMTYALAPLPS